MHIALRPAVLAILVGLAPASHAAVITGAFNGTLYEGVDGAGVFGPADANLGNAAITGTYSYDTDLLTTSTAGGVSSGSGFGGALTVTIAIGGQSYTFTDETGSTAAFDAASGSLDLSATTLQSGSYSQFQLSAVPGTNDASGTGLEQGFTTTELLFSLGTFIITDFNVATSGSFTLAGLSQSGLSQPGPASVPEPASLALLLPALWAAAARRRPTAR